MNHVQLISEAINVMEKFQKTHVCYCVLSIQNGKVVGLVPQAAQSCFNRHLKITQWEMEHGLCSCKWQAIGEALLDLYNSESLD